MEASLAADLAERQLHEKLAETFSEGQEIADVAADPRAPSRPLHDKGISARKPASRAGLGAIPTEWRRAWKLELIERFNPTCRDLFEDFA
jgi:hypothetical protein